METEIKLLIKNDFLNLLVRPFKTDSTKVIMRLTGSKVRQEVILENKSYRGALIEEPASFIFEQLDINFELGFTGDPFKNGHYTFKV